MLGAVIAVVAVAAAGPPTPHDRPLLHCTSPNSSLGDAVGLIYNRILRRYEVMWDSHSACGWGHASTTDFLSYTQRGCAGPDRSGGPTMSGSVAVRADGRCTPPSDSLHRHARVSNGVTHVSAP